MLFTLQRYEFFSKSQPFLVLLSAYRDVVYPTKVRIFQQITTFLRQDFFWKRCCLPYKGTNFSANHNPMIRDRGRKFDVVYPTKVRIFQQITTVSPCNSVKLVMLFTLQRYEFFSKSQHLIMRVMLRQRCCLPYKGTNFSANHNKIIVLYTYRLDVVY